MAVQVVPEGDEGLFFFRRQEMVEVAHGTRSVRLLIFDLDEGHRRIAAIDHIMLDPGIAPVGGTGGHVDPARAGGLFQQELAVGHRHDNIAHAVDMLAGLGAGLALAGLLNGSVAIEVVFAWPGIGRLMLEGIKTRDFPIVQATVLAAGFFYIFTALVVDILYAYVNPRIRFE